MRTALAAFVIFGLASCAPPAGDAGDTGLTDARNERIAAMIAGDADALDRLLADDLVYTHTTARVDSKQSIIETLAAGVLSYDGIDVVEIDQRVTGDIALATGTAEFRVSTPDRAFGFTARFTEVSRRSGDGWQLVAWQSTRIPPTE